MPRSRCTVQDLNAYDGAYKFRSGSQNSGGIKLIFRKVPCSRYDFNHIEIGRYRDRAPHSTEGASTASGGMQTVSKAHPKSNLFAMAGTFGFFQIKIESHATSRISDASQ